MASLYTKFLDFIGIEESDEPEEERDEYYREESDSRADNVVHFGNRAQSRAKAEKAAPTASTGSNLPISGGMKMIVYHPVSYEDTQIIIDNLKNRKPVIVNMEELDVECAQRILDFLSGAVYALSGTMCKISRGIFVVAPNNYDVVGNNDDFGDSM
jgi:cell division inhibitor SepF